MDWLIYPPLGAVAGVLAGLLGVGGGIVIVPMLDIVFTLQGLPGESIHKMALATSLGSIMFTSISSMRAHHGHGAVIWDIVRTITPGILLGTYIGTGVAARMPNLWLKGFFVLFLYYVATQMVLNYKPKPHRGLPGRLPMFGVGNVIGFVSSLVGIGGGTMSVPFMVWCNVTMHKAVGTSAAIGLPIAVAGTLGYVLNVPEGAVLPPSSLGYLYLPALIGIALVSILTAPLGAKLAHSLPVPRLKKAFAVFLYIMATRMLLGLMA